MNKPRGKMPVSERAKQFMPFAALRGLPAALREKERTVQPRRELTEDNATDLEQKLAAARCGSTVTVEYYGADGYICVSGILKGTDPVARALLVSGERIALDDILDIRPTETE